MADVLARSPHVLLDFDGPVCSVFDGTSDLAVADQLRATLQTYIGTMPDETATSSDPFDVLRFAAHISEDCASLVEREFARLEMRAVVTAPATPGAREAMISLRQGGHTITIVSNNSALAVAAYVNANGLHEAVDGIAARIDPSPAHLKPSPYLLRIAMRDLGAEPAECVLIGDSVTDIQAAHNSGVKAIGYANKPGKRSHFVDERADAVIDHMTELVL